MQLNPSHALWKLCRFLAELEAGRAADTLDASRKRTEKHGELAPECGDALILYGKALLYNAIAQSAVLGGGPGGETKQETEQVVRESSGSHADFRRR